MRRLRDYAHMDGDTAPLEAIRRLPELYDMTLQLPVVPFITVEIKGFDAAARDELAFESRIMPEQLIASRQLEQES